MLLCLAVQVFLQSFQTVLHLTTMQGIPQLNFCRVNLPLYNKRRSAAQRASKQYVQSFLSYHFDKNCVQLQNQYWPNRGFLPYCLPKWCAATPVLSKDEGRKVNICFSALKIAEQQIERLV